MPKQALAKRDGVINHFYIFNQFLTQKILMLSKRYESTEVDRTTWLHVPSGTLVHQQWPEMLKSFMNKQVKFKDLKNNASPNDKICSIQVSGIRSSDIDGTGFHFILIFSHPSLVLSVLSLPSVLWHICNCWKFKHAWMTIFPKITNMSYL